MVKKTQQPKFVAPPVSKVTSVQTTDTDLMDAPGDPSEMEPPRIGDMVHFYPMGINNLNEHYYAAVINKIWSPTCVSLSVFTSNQGVLSMQSIQHGDYMRDASYWLYR